VILEKQENGYYKISTKFRMNESNEVPKKDFLYELTKEKIKEVNESGEEIYVINDPPIETNELLTKENKKKYEKTLNEKVNILNNDLTFFKHFYFIITLSLSFLYLNLFYKIKK
jgi:hypothetical protein